jgi:Tfp pilus assembly protein PilV
MQPFPFRFLLYRTRSRRGLTLIEVLLSATLMLSLVGVLAGLSSTICYAYQRSIRVASTDLTAQMAMSRIAPTIRGARSVTSVGAAMVTLQSPAYDASGDLVVPMTNGHVYSFYLSNATGSAAANGNILWRSVDGTPDSAWSLANGQGVCTLSALSFAYPYADTVTVSLSSTKNSGSALAAVGTTTDTFTNSQDVMLRNYGL